MAIEAGKVEKKEVVNLVLTDIKASKSDKIMKLVNDDDKIVILRLKTGDVKLSPVKYS